MNNFQTIIVCATLLACAFIFSRSVPSKITHLENNAAGSLAALGEYNYGEGKCLREKHGKACVAHCRAVGVKACLEMQERLGL